MRIFVYLFIIILFFSSIGAPPDVWAVTCAPPIAGDFEVNEDCSFAGATNGVDGGSGDTNDAVLTVTSGILTIQPGQTIAFGSLILNGGIVAIPSNSSLLLAGASLWMIDADNDGYPETPDQIASRTDPGGGAKRRFDIVDTNTTDCYDGNSDVFYGQLQYFTVDRGDGSFDYDCDSEVIKQRTSCSCSCDNACLASPECSLIDATTEADDCGTTDIDAGPSSCTRSDDVYGNCESCTGSGVTYTTMACR